jgi:hypothetical protein
MAEKSIVGRPRQWMTREQLEQDCLTLSRQYERERAENEELRHRLKLASCAVVPQHVPLPGSHQLTESWLRDVGFTWSDVERSPHKHWTLRIGTAQTDGDGMMRSSDDLMVELTPGRFGSGGESPEDRWFCWLRADYAGRYNRFLFAREITCVEQLVRLIESLTDTPFSPLNVRYGMLHTPEGAERFRRDEQRLDWGIAKQYHEMSEAAK